MKSDYLLANVKLDEKTASSFAGLAKAHDVDLYTPVDNLTPAGLQVVLMYGAIVTNEFKDGHQCFKFEF